MAISTGVVVVFTFALFLAGYVLQQETVKNLQAAVRPRPGFPLIQTSFAAEPTPIAGTGSMIEPKYSHEQYVLSEEQDWDTGDTYLADDGQGEWSSVMEDSVDYLEYQSTESDMMEPEG